MWLNDTFYNWYLGLTTPKQTQAIQNQIQNEIFSSTGSTKDTNFTYLDFHDNGISDFGLQKIAENLNVAQVTHLDLV